MKLLNYTTRYFLILIFSLLMVWCAVFYFSLQWTIYKDIDEYLVGRQHEIIRSIQKNPAILKEKPLYHTDFKIKEIKQTEYDRSLQKHASGKFKNTQRFDELENEQEPFRKIEAVFESEGKYYKIAVTASLLNSEELLLTVFFDILIFAIALIALAVLLNRTLLNKIWEPFYRNIQKINNYKLDDAREIKLTQTKITEFNEMNKTVEQLVSNNQKTYQSQKQFVENASHEIQTPLGILQNKVDLLIESPGVTPGQAQLIDAILINIDRLSRLNKTLLLLTKIENNQFPDKEQIDLSEIISFCCADFTELIEYKDIALKVEYISSVVLNINRDLAIVLFSNLIKNAVNHNIPRGYIKIAIESNKVVIENSGKELTAEPEKMFERFTKRSESAQSNGLGLAIVKGICNLYNFSILYENNKEVHKISIGLAS